MRDDSSGNSTQAAAIGGKLREAFSCRGIVGGAFLPRILDQERRYAPAVLEMTRGHRFLMDCFYDFFIETLFLTRDTAAEGGATGKRCWYPRLFQYFLFNFRRFRGGDVLLLTGYPLLGYSLVRDLKDGALALAAIAGRETSVRALEGLRQGDVIEDTPDFRRRLGKQRMQEEKRVREVMLREQSGLDEATRGQLRRWEQLFNLEVHGSRLSMSSEGGEWLRGDRPMTVGPCLEEKAVAAFANTSRQVAWLHLKTFPVLQLKPHAFSGEWEEKWRLLDRAFRFHMHSLVGIGKPVADAIVKLGDAKFDFDLGTHYVESE